MRTFVRGAGVSYPIYPLGGSLLKCIGDYIKSCRRCFDRFDYEKAWPGTLKWLEDNPDPLLREAYRTGNIEQIFTVLDLSQSLYEGSLDGIWHGRKDGPAAVSSTEQAFEKLKTELATYQETQRILLRATEAYFQHRHEEDQTRSQSEEWGTLRTFAEKLQKHDVIVTFNYDSTIERVLYEQGKWSPKDGYGTDLVFQRGHRDSSPVDFPASPVKVLHLHGAIGWYTKPVFGEDFAPPSDGAGAVPREAFTPALLPTEISLAPSLLQGFGISAVDASMPTAPPDEYQILLHPSFLKDYAGANDGTAIFRRIWKLASERLRDAEKVVVVGYSLPPADTAAWVLLLATCDGAKTEIVNPDRTVMARYRRMLHTPSLFEKPRSFQEWVKHL